MLKTRMIIVIFVIFCGKLSGKSPLHINHIKKLIEEKQVNLALHKAKRLSIHTPTHQNKQIYYGLIDVVANNLARHSGYESSISFIRKHLADIIEPSNQEYFVKKIGYLYAINQQWQHANIVAKHYVKNKKMRRYTADMLYLLALSFDKQNKQVLAKMAYDKLTLSYPNHGKSMLAGRRAMSIAVELKNRAQNQDPFSPTFRKDNMAVGSFLEKNRL